LIEAHGSWGPALAALATITILVGNVGALGQSSLKRMLAYSSVAQAGYMLAGVVVATRLGAQSMVFYLAVYLAMNMAAFAVIVARERETDLGDNVQAMAGLGGERPWLAWPMTISMLALAGIPATAGFIGKFYLIDAAVAGGYTWLGVVIAIGSMISLGYYLPVIATMWMSSSATAPASATPAPGAIPAIAGGSPELDDEPEDPASKAGAPVPATASDRSLSSPTGDGAATSGLHRQPELVFVAVLAGASTIVLGIVPQPLFNLVHGVGSALGLL
jgi:NADH-quinone oxidoreductase subunit N